MLLGMLVLVANPRLAPRGLRFTIAQDRIEECESIAGRARDGAAHPERNARDGIVKAEDDDAAAPHETRHGRKRCARVGCVMKDAGGIDDVKRTVTKSRSL